VGCETCDTCLSATLAYHARYRVPKKFNSTFRLFSPLAATQGRKGAAPGGHKVKNEGRCGGFPLRGDPLSGSRAILA